MASIRPCNKCGQRISIRQMPHEQWVAFNVSTDNPHKCSKKKTKQKKLKKNNKEDAYHGISLGSEIEKNIENNDLENQNFQNEIDEIENLKSLSKTEKNERFKSNNDSIFSNPLFIAIIIVIILSIFVYPNL